MDMGINASSSPTTPTVTTTTVGSITTSGAISGGTVTSNGGASVTSEGTCYATSANPTSPCTSDGTATPFTSTITGLASSTLYHYRAFATNSVGTGYGSDLTFTTLTPGGGGTGNSQISISGSVIIFQLKENLKCDFFSLSSFVLYLGSRTSYCYSYCSCCSN